MSDTDQKATTLELRFFATFRTAVGQKEIERQYDASSVGDVLTALEAEFPDLEGQILDDDGTILPQLTVLKNGREVVHLEGVDTELHDGDRLSVFPPVAGGMHEQRQFRGISKRLAIEYLENLGGEATDDGVVGDGWEATLSEKKVTVVGSFVLNEVTVDFEGDPETLEPLIEKFAQKAMRAGG